jgi:predicted alpha/beta superfamily hydrolase
MAKVTKAGQKFKTKHSDKVYTVKHFFDGDKFCETLEEAMQSSESKRLGWCLVVNHKSGGTRNIDTYLIND